MIARFKGALTLILPRPMSELRPSHLYTYLDALWRTRALPGAVVEVGCFQGATAAVAKQMLREGGIARDYVCVDTFGGFVDSQFSKDEQAGTAAGSLRHGFTLNSQAMVRRFLTRWGVPEIKLIEADVVALPASALPEQIAVALIDVDLEEPIYAALEKVYPRVVAGGAILVDDCGTDPANPYRGARVGYQRFVEQHHLPERYMFGMGVIDK
jgi:O-methyltransferase